MIKSNRNIIYAQFLSSLFSSISIVGLSVLCLLNHLSFDIYNMFFLLKVVIPAGLCAWILGFVIGKILDSYHNKIEAIREHNEKQAYEIPSMFGGSSTEEEDPSLLDMEDL